LSGDNKIVVAGTLGGVPRYQRFIFYCFVDEREDYAPAGDAAISVFIFKEHDGVSQMVV
jgi:hypothetical protein